MGLSVTLLSYSYLQELLALRAPGHRVKESREMGEREVEEPVEDYVRGRGACEISGVCDDELLSLLRKLLHYVWCGNLGMRKVKSV